MAFLFILPFDHRGSFHKMIFPDSKELNDEQKDVIRDYKRVIFESVKLIGERIGYQDLAVLVDEEYGKEIHAEAKRMGIRNILTIEKSGQKIFDFEYADWKEHLSALQPSYAKALIRVVMGEDHQVQNSRLKALQDFCFASGIGFLIEPLIEPSAEDLQGVSGDKKRFDAELRPLRFAEAVAEMHAAGITPDVWKIEGTETKAAMDICSEAVFQGGKPGVQIVILGRGAGQDEVDHWLREAANSRGVNGFAVGRTVFGETITRLHRGEMSRAEASAEIAQKFEHCLQVFSSAR